MKESSPAHQCLEIIVAESVGALGVQRSQVAVSLAGSSGAVGLPRGREGGVDVGLVVDAVSEGGAPSLADGVGAGEGHHLPGRESLRFEFGDDGIQVFEESRKVTVSTALVGRCRISSPTGTEYDGPPNYIHVENQ
ncbi:unnamed protein product [Victoria cruziana]